jgi:tetratricopeptide (TPR) repeat protein
MAALVALGSVTIVYSRAYRAARHERAETHFERGKALARQARYQAAIEQYRAALLFSHNDPQYRLALARALLAVQNWKEAATHLGELRDRDPSSGEINLMLARIAAREHLTAAAIEDYHRAIFGYWPQDPRQNRLKARFELIGLYESAGDRKKVLAQLLELAAEAPDDPEVEKRVGELLLRYGSANHAAEMFRAATALNPKDAGAWSGLGQAEQAMDNWTAALSAFRTASRYAPGDVEVAAAMASAEEALRLDPTGVRLSPRERYARSLAILRRTLGALERCTGATVLPPQAASAAAAARARLEAGPTGYREGAVPTTLALAQELWHARQNTCRAVPESDAALGMVMRRIAK